MTRQGLLVGALALLCVLITLGQPRFLILYNWLNIFQQAAAIGLVSSGVALLMIGGGFDLSVGSVVALGGYIVAVGFGAGLPIPLVILLAVLAGAALGPAPYWPWIAGTGALLAAWAARTLRQSARAAAAADAAVADTVDAFRLMPLPDAPTGKAVGEPAGPTPENDGVPTPTPPARSTGGFARSPSES